MNLRQTDEKAVMLAILRGTVEDGEHSLMRYLPEGNPDKGKGGEVRSLLYGVVANSAPHPLAVPAMLAMVEMGIYVGSQLQKIQDSGVEVDVEALKQEVLKDGGLKEKLMKIMSSAPPSTPGEGAPEGTTENPMKDFLGGFGKGA